MEEVIVIVVIVALVYLIYRHYFSNNDVFQQLGGAINGNERIFRDREEYFLFEKGIYPYLNKITDNYQESISLLEKKIDKIKNFISEYERTKELIDDKTNLTSFYTIADVKRKENEIEQLRQTYNRHLNLFIELSHLNNQLLVYELYSQKSSNSNNNKKRTILDTYNKRQQELQKSYGELTQRR